MVGSSNRFKSPRDQCRITLRSRVCVCVYGTYTRSIFKVIAATPFNSSPSSAKYMRQWIGSALVQIMACRLNAAKPLSEPVLLMEFYLKLNTFIQENTFEHIVCEMAAILSRGKEITCIITTAGSVRCNQYVSNQGCSLLSPVVSYG